MVRRNQLTGTPETIIEDENAAPPLNGATAPEGSAERVRDDGRITVTDYDANGEASDFVVLPTSRVEPMPGFDAPQLDLWGDYHGRRVNSMTLSFSGTCDLDGLREDVRAAAPGLDLGKRLTLLISGTVTGVKHKSSEPRGPVGGGLTLAVDDVMFAAEDAAEELRERIQGALSMLADLGSEIDEWTEIAGAPDMPTVVRRYIADLFDVLNGEGDPLDPAALMEDLAAAGLVEAVERDDEEGVPA